MSGRRASWRPGRPIARACCPAWKSGRRTSSTMTERVNRIAEGCPDPGRGNIVHGGGGPINSEVAPAELVVRPARQDDRARSTWRGVGGDLLMSMRRLAL